MCIRDSPTSVDTRVEAPVPSSYQITVPKKITLTVTKDSSNGGYTGYADYKVNVDVYKRQIFVNSFH